MFTDKFPTLYYMTRNEVTNSVSYGHFNDKVCPGWSETPLCDLNKKAEEKIDDWNQNTAWFYEIIGWGVT